MKKKESVLHRFAWKKIFVVLLIVGAGVGFYFWKKSGGNSFGGGGAVLVKVEKVELKNVPFEIQEAGNVVAKETVLLKSRVDSQIMEVNFEDGGEVVKDQILFVLDSRSLEAQLNQAEANLARDKAQLENLEKQYKRSQALVKKGYESESSLDAAKADYEVAKANLDASQAAVENLRVQIGYTKVVAPISGRAGTINFTVGNTVKANDSTPLVTINQIKPIRIQASLSEKYLEEVRAKIDSGISASVVHDSGYVSVGKLEYMDNQVDQATGRFLVKAIFANEQEKLWPGMFVNLKINLGGGSNLLTIPEVAVQHGQKGDFVFVIKDKKAEKRAIEVSRVQDGIAVIKSGLKEAEMVAVDGILFLRDGSLVEF